MKFKQEIRHRLVDRTIDGITNQVSQSYTVDVPKLPADWDGRALKGAVGTVLALTAVSVTWSTVSIGAILHGGVGYAAAGLFDASWIVTLLLEYLARFDPTKRQFAKVLGWILLGVTMAAIFTNGAIKGDWAMAAVGASVSVLAKLLWLGVMRFVDRDLAPEDRQWVAQEMSKANAKLAISGVRRAAAKAEAIAVADLLAAEQIRTAYMTAAVEMVSADRPAVSAEQAPELSALLANVRPTSAPTETNPQVSTSAAPEAVRPDTAPAPLSPAFLAPELPETVRPAANQEPEELPVYVEDEARVPVQVGRMTAAEAVRTLTGKGINDLPTLEALVPALVGRPVQTDTIKREARRQRNAVTSPLTSTGDRGWSGGYQ